MFIDKYIYDEKDRYRDVSYNLKYDGIVVSKYISNNHASRVVVLDNGKDLIIHRNYLEIYDSIVIGDKMQKDKGTLVGYVYRDTALLYEIDYNWR